MSSKLSSIFPMDCSGSTENNFIKTCPLSASMFSDIQISIYITFYQYISFIIYSLNKILFKMQ